MMRHNAEMQRCMRTLDVVGARRLWAAAMPNMPQPKNDKEVLATLHLARTAAASMPATARLYSHDWLLDHNLPSHMPEEMLPPSRRSEKRIVETVGISVNTGMAELKPVAQAIEQSMSDAVADAYAESRTDVEFVRARMAEAGAKTRKKLLGTVAPLR